MCGIAGWMCWGDKRPKAHTIKGLLLANMERGTSATGMAYLGGQGDHIIVRKGKGPASDFIANTTDEEFEIAAQSPRGLLHARATTKGSENANENNHPVVGLGWVAIHNGSVGNDDDLWGYYAEKEGVKRFAEVDTSVIPLMLSRGTSVEDSVKKLSALSGTLTIAAWSETDKDRILLGRFGHNDLHMFYDAGTNILYWSSASSAAYVMRGILMGKHKFLTLSRLADEHVLLLSPDGLEATRVFKVVRRPFHAARKVVRESIHAGTIPASHTGTTSVYPPRTAEESAQTFIALPPGRTESGHRSGSSAVTSLVRSTTGWKEINGRDRQKDMQAGKDYVKVMFQPPADGLMLAASWKAAEMGMHKPLPTSDVFTKVWWNLSGILHTLQKDSVVMSVIKETAYGRWEIGIDDQKEVSMQFRGHKRTKSWWNRMYRVKFKFPLEIDPTDQKTALCDHLAWEHYDIQLQKSDKSTTSFLGFMCPWCGVWMSATRVQEMRFRCEFCCIRSRTGPIEGGMMYG